MLHYKLVNNFESELAGSVAPTDTTITLVDAQGKFNDASDIVRYKLTLFVKEEVEGQMVETKREVVDVIAANNNTLTVERGVDGTTALDWNGDTIEQRLTAEVVAQINANIDSLVPTVMELSEWSQLPVGTEASFAVSPLDGANAGAVVPAQLTVADLAEGTDLYNSWASFDPYAAESGEVPIGDGAPLFLG